MAASNPKDLGPVLSIVEGMVALLLLLPGYGTLRRDECHPQAALSLGDALRRRLPPSIEPGQVLTTLLKLTD